MRIGKANVQHNVYVVQMIMIRNAPYFIMKLNFQIVKKI